MQEESSRNLQRNIAPIANNAVRCTAKCVKRADLTLGALTAEQTNNSKEAVGHEETFGSDGYVVMVSRGLAYVQNDKFVYILNVCMWGYISYTSTKRFKTPIFKYYNLGKKIQNLKFLVMIK